MRSIEKLPFIVIFLHNETLHFVGCIVVSWFILVLTARVCRFNFKLIFFLLQASGVTVSDICKTTYEEIKKDKKHRYVVFYIRDEKQIDVEVIGESKIWENI